MMTKLGYSVFQRVTTAPLLRKMCLLALTVPLLASSAISLATASKNESKGENERYAIGLWGDFPYSDQQATTGVPNLIADMNAQNLAFTVHDGDLKAGNSIDGSVTPTTCSNDLYTQVLGYFNALKAPAVFTPGDNDWTDCDRPSNGGFNSLLQTTPSPVETRLIASLQGFAIRLIISALAVLQSVEDL